ncbi:ABC1 family-domain-containing protein [Naematelia encephala]|uniref:ABC1 family-domain-containing protein n=1 Tax=Naematelia encephala TaxID=71784 RepID=A0A1Y2AK77_9TREE|nr:ABC1 family-domain-containing protein [Naematelia encephala]
MRLSSRGPVAFARCPAYRYQHNGRLTGSDKLFADAEQEEATSSRDHFRYTQGPVWTGEETKTDAGLRVLVDSHKPLRTGQGVRSNSADDKIQGWMNGLRLEPRIGTVQSAAPESQKLHRTHIPPHLHRPWHATYTGDNQTVESPKVKYGMFIKKRADGDALTNLLELRLPPDADAKTKARLRDMKRAGKIVRRFERARDGVVGYQLGLEMNVGQEVDDDETFQGNRQTRGSSVLGAKGGAASGLRAWSGLVEDRILRAREAGLLKVTRGIGQPIPRDPEDGNPHLDKGELLMNRIVKRQGALPAWIELQNSLDSTLVAFRSTLLSTYTTHLVRNIISTTALEPLPPRHVIPDRDESWEARELKFHEENVKQINDQVRRMNAVAPSPARRNLITREQELGKVRGELLRATVWTEIVQRAEEAKALPKPVQSGPLSLFGPGRPSKGSQAAATLSSPTRTRSQDDFFRSWIPLGAAFAGVGLFVFYRRPAQADSHPQPVPSEEEEEVPFDEEPSALPTTINKFLHDYLIEPLATLFRFLHLAFLFGPVILTSPMLFIGRPERRRRVAKPVADAEENWGAVWWYGFLVKQMERAGPSFIKLGQWAASRADLFPSALCDKMSKLHSNGKPHSLRHTKRIVEHSFGVKFEDIFDEFIEEPIGCGAIAQVYKAKLKPGFSGETASVAIKVLHPRVRQTIRRDIAIMSIFANAINLLPGMQWLSLPEEVAVFGDMMHSQLDLRVEASNLERFDHNFANRGRRITFPRPIRLGRPTYDSKDVLVEEFQDALPLKWFLRNGGGPYDNRIANYGLDAFLVGFGELYELTIRKCYFWITGRMAIFIRKFHTELSNDRGNIMVRFYKPTTGDYLSPILSHLRAPQDLPDSVDDLVHSLSSLAHDPEAWRAKLESLYEEKYEAQLIFIDAGLVTSLDGNNRKNFLDLFQAIAEFDGYKAGKLMIERCRFPEYAIDEETFALKIQHIVLSVKSRTFSLAKIKIADILTDVLTAVRQHHVKLEGDFVNTVISILLLEGIGRQLDPDMDLFKSALPILRQLGRQLGTREAIAAVPKGNIWAMAKVWVWMEAREVAGELSAVDDWIKFDRLSPAI